MTSRLVQKIAEHYSINPTHANDFLYSVQRRCHPDIPRYQLIVDVIFKMGYTTLPKPEQVADEIKKNRQVDETQYSHRNPKASNKHGRENLGGRSKWLSRNAGRLPSIYEKDITKLPGLEPGVKPYSPFDKERVSPEHLDRCPHDVPLGELCGICDPEGFKRMTGIE